MTIYFAGSIRGGLPDREHYQRLISYLRQFGQVLTEHVGDLERSTKREDTQTIQEIYTEDLRWLEQSDVVVAEVTTPSLGVGYELATAERLQKPTLCLYRPGPDRSLSLMVRGNPYFTVGEYQTLSEAENYIQNFLLAKR
ncbi:MAG: nucleoside 2-deoxyribosyltransferase [Patescibacteria group bacterium]|jgi:nucleoside 2-deoxyribosyltransferase